MYLLIKREKLLNEYKQICNKISYYVEKELGGEPIHNGKYIKIKLKSNNCKIDTDFHDNRMLENGPCCIWFTVISIDSVFEIGKSCYS